MRCWLDAYDGGMGVREVRELQVQKFSSQKYKSH